jgi:DNA-binding NarL/FixJ family response regulator
MRSPLSIDLLLMRGSSFPRSRIVLADDHKATVAAVASFLETDYDVVGAVSDGQSLVEAIEKLRPDVAVVDISMPRMSGLEAGSRVRDLGSRTRVVFLTHQRDPAFLYAAMAIGALGYVLKHRLASDLPLAIEAALAGRRFVSPPLADLHV